MYRSLSCLDCEVSEKCKHFHIEAVIENIQKITQGTNKESNRGHDEINHTLTGIYTTFLS